MDNENLNGGATNSENADINRAVSADANAGSGAGSAENGADARAAARTSFEEKAREREYLGRFFFNMDSKGRVTLPAKLREELGEGFYVTNGYEGCLSIYDREGWAEFSGKIRRLPSTNKAARFMQRTFLSGADKPEPDKQGKILITPPHRQYAGLTKEVVILGVGDHIEIWDLQRWNNYNSDNMSLEEAAEELDKLMW